MKFSSSSTRSNASFAIDKGPLWLGVRSSSEAASSTCPFTSISSQHSILSRLGPLSNLTSNVSSTDLSLKPPIRRLVERGGSSSPSDGSSVAWQHIQKPFLVSSMDSQRDSLTGISWSIAGHRSQDVPHLTTSQSHQNAERLSLLSNIRRCRILQRRDTFMGQDGCSQNRTSTPSSMQMVCSAKPQQETTGDSSKAPQHDYWQSDICALPRSQVHPSTFETRNDPLEHRSEDGLLSDRTSSMVTSVSLNPGRRDDILLASPLPGTQFRSIGIHSRYQAAHIPSRRMGYRGESVFRRLPRSNGQQNIFSFTDPTDLSVQDKRCLDTSQDHGGIIATSWSHSKHDQVITDPLSLQTPPWLVCPNEPTWIQSARREDHRSSSLCFSLGSQDKRQSIDAGQIDRETNQHRISFPSPTRDAMGTSERSLLPWYTLGGSINPSNSFRYLDSQAEDFGHRIQPFSPLSDPIGGGQSAGGIHGCKEKTNDRRTSMGTAYPIAASLSPSNLQKGRRHTNPRTQSHKKSTESNLLAATRQRGPGRVSLDPVYRQLFSSRLYDTSLEVNCQFENASHSLEEFCTRVHAAKVPYKNDLLGWTSQFSSRLPFQSPTILLARGISTMATYARKFNMFCRWLCCKRLNYSPSSLMAFLIDLQQKDSFYAKEWKAAIIYLVTLIGDIDKVYDGIIPSFKDIRLTLMAEGLHRAAPHMFRPQKAPIRWQHLVKIYQHPVKDDLWLRDLSMFIVSIFLCLRACELAALTKESVKILDNGAIAVTLVRMKQGRGKTSGAPTTLCIVDLNGFPFSISRILRDYWTSIRGGDLLFKNRSSILTSTSISSIFQKRYEICSIKGEVTSHCAKHGGATFAAERGKSIEMIRVLGGWSLKSETPLRYIHDVVQIFTPISIHLLSDLC